jgi:hypothetical protein
VDGRDQEVDKLWMCTGNLFQALACEYLELQLFLMQAPWEKREKEEEDNQCITILNLIYCVDASVSFLIETFNPLILASFV